MGVMKSQITSLTIVYSTIYSGADRRKRQSSASLTFVRRIHRWPVNSPHKWPVTRKIYPFNDVIMAMNRMDNTPVSTCIYLLVVYYTCVTKVSNTGQNKENRQSSSWQILRYQWYLCMMTSSFGNIFRVTGPLCGEFTGHRWNLRHKGQWHGALMFSLICASTNGWVNNRGAGDWRRHRAHNDVTVMGYPCTQMRQMCYHDDSIFSRQRDLSICN